MSVDIASLVMAVDSRQVAEGTKNLDAMALAGKKAEASTLALEAANKVLAAAARTVSSAFAAYKIMDLIRDSAMLAARFETMGVVMKVAGNNAGYTRSQMEEYSKALQKSGISMMESRNVLVQLSTANIDLANAAKLGRAAQDLAVVGNINSSEALGRLVHGLKSGEVEILRTLGLNVKFEDGYKKMAAQLGTTSEELTEQQKVLSRTNSALTEAAKYQGIYEESMTTAGKAMSSLTRYWEDAKVKLGESFLPAVATAVFALTDALKAANAELTKAGQSGLISGVGDALNNSLKVAFQATAVVGANLVFVLTGIGREIGAIAAQGARLAVLDFKGAAAIGEAATEDADAARRALEAFEQRMLSVGQTAEVVATQTEQQRIATGKASRDAAEAEEKRMAAAAAAAKASKKAGDEQETFVKGLEKEVAALGRSNSERKLQEAQLLKLTGTRMAHVQAMVLEMAQYQLAEDKASTRAEQRNKEYADIEALMKAEKLRLVEVGNAADAAVVAAREEYEQFGLSKSAVLELTLAKMEGRAKMLQPDSDAYNSLKREIAAQKELISIAQKTEVRDANIKAAEDATDAWKKANTQVEQSLSDALMNAFQAGKGFGKTFVDAIKSMFNTMVLRPVISAIVSPVAGAVTSALGFSGAANAATGGAGGLSDVTSLLGGMGTVGSTVAGWLGLGGATAAGVAANVGIGTAAGLTAAEATAAASAAAAAAEAGLMTTLAPLLAAAPYLAAIAGVYMLAKKLDKSGTPHSGGGALYSASGGLQTQGLSNGWSGGGAYLTDFGGYKVTADATQMAAGITQSVVGLLDSAASTFGQQAGYAAATAFADDSSSDGAWGALAIKLGDKMVAEWGQWANGPGGTTFSDGSAGSAEYLAKISSDVRTVLNGIDMPGWAKKVLNDLPDGATLQQLGEAVAAINKTQTAWNQLGKTLAGFAAMSDDAKVKLTSASGGIDALVTNASTYYANFYTEGERTAATLGSIKTAFDAVNVPMPATREAFRTLVESLEATADTNPYASAALATVLSMSGAFASVVPAAAAAEEATTTLVDTVEEIATLGQELDALRNPVRGIKDVAQGIFNLEKEGQSLQVELWRTYGDSNSLLAANKLQRDIETAGMTKQELRLYNLNAARRAEIDTIVQQRQAHADAVASWQAYFDLFATPQEKQTRARAIVQAVLPADVDTLQEYKDYVWGLTVQFGLGSAEMKAATDVAQQFTVAFPEVAQEITEASAASTVLTKDLSAYYAALFTPAEQVGYATGVMAQKFADLGLTMPTTVQGFKDLVAGLDTTTEAGRVAYNTVVGLAGAWKDLQPAVAAAVTATTDLSAYHAAYFTEAERAGLATTSLTATLAAVGLALPTTRDGFRALVEAQDLNTESGIRTYNTLIGVAGAFADLVPAATEGAAAVETLDDILKGLRNPVRTLEQIAGNIVSLEEELFQAQNAGNTQALRDHLLAGLTPDEQKLKKAIWAIEDYNQSVVDSAAAAQTAADEQRQAAEALAAAAQKIASEHDSLWRQWLTVNEDTAALRALDLAALDPSNRALQEQIWALEDQKKAADEATSAAEQMRSAWGSLTDSMIDEVRRIRGLIDESSGASYASLAAQFATATAQTRAGDQAAAKLLPGLSQSMLTAYEGTATSLVDLQRVRALTANSLETTASLASGTTPAGYGMATAEPVYTTAPAASATQATTAQTAELQGLRAEVAALRAALEAVVINTGKSTRLHQKWDDVGIPVTNPPDGAPLSVA